MAQPNLTRAERAIRFTTILSVIVLAVIAAIMSYKHMYLLVRRYGETSWTAALLPVSVDGMIVASSMSLLLDSRHARRSGILPWVLLVVGSTASLAANVAVAEPSAVGRLIAGWPSCALIGSYELLMRQVRNASHTTSPTGSDALQTSPIACKGGSSAPSYEPAGNGPGSYASRMRTVADDAASHGTHTFVEGHPPYGSDNTSTDAGRDRAADGKRVERVRVRSGRSSVLQRQAWQWALTNRTTNGDLPSGRAIAQAFGRRERWGRLVKQAGHAGRLDSAAIAK